MPKDTLVRQKSNGRCYHFIFFNEISTSKSRKSLCLVFMLQQEVPDKSILWMLCVLEGNWAPCKFSCFYFTRHPRWKLDIFDQPTKKQLHPFYYLWPRHFSARPYSHFCHFPVRRVLEMAQSAVCRWAVIHGCNSCSPHTAIWLFYRCSCLHPFLSPFPSTGNSLHEAKIHDSEAFSACRVILSPLKENCIRAGSVCRHPLHWPIGTPTVRCETSVS